MGEPSNSLQNQQQREQFGSRISFVLASMGGAIGLGNIWKFPYLVGRHGGRPVTGLRPGPDDGVRHRA